MVHSPGRTAALRGRPRAGRVDEDAAHEPGRQREEMDAIVPVDPVRIEQADVDLVNECGALERGARALAAHASASMCAQFVVDERCELLQRALISGTPGLQQSREIGRVRRHHAAF